MIKVKVGIEENTKVIEQCTKDIKEQVEAHTQSVVDTIFNKIRANVDDRHLGDELDYLNGQIEAWQNGWQSYLEEEERCIDTLEAIECTCELIDSELSEMVETIDDEITEVNETIEGFIDLAVEVERYHSDSMSRNVNFVKHVSDADSVHELPTNMLEIR